MAREFGVESGAVCWRNGCQEVITDTPPHDISCSCHMNAPCGKCSTDWTRCDECGWKVSDDTDFTYRHIGMGIAEMVTKKPVPLDPRKIDYRIEGHSSASQKCIGVYPEGTTKAEVEARCRGSFGGRFEQFGNGKFTYVAYTD